MKKTIATLAIAGSMTLGALACGEAPAPATDWTVGIHCSDLENWHHAMTEGTHYGHAAVSFIARQLQLTESDARMAMDACGVDY